jgi:hypothetical protein
MLFVLIVDMYPLKATPITHQTILKRIQRTRMIRVAHFTTQNLRFSFVLI